MLAALSLAVALCVGVPSPARARLAALSAPALSTSDRGSGPRSDPRWVPVLVGFATAGISAVFLGGGSGMVTGLVLGPVGGWVAHRVVRRDRRPPTDPLRLAAGWGLLAVCLRAGAPVPAAVGAAVAELPPGAREVLDEVADLLALGADPVAAWDVAGRDPDVGPLAAAARRTARSGAALAGAVEDLADELRGRSVDHSEARAQRAAVLIAAPLTVCFLPAFVCLGVVPVVIGLAGGLTAGW